MEISKVMALVTSFFNAHLQPIHKMTCVRRKDNQTWEVLVEVIEEKEYMKAYAKEEMIGIYKVEIDGNMQIISFCRQGIRPRGAIPKENER